MEMGRGFPLLANESVGAMLPMLSSTSVVTVSVNCSVKRSNIYQSQMTRAEKMVPSNASGTEH